MGIDVAIRGLTLPTSAGGTVTVSGLSFTPTTVFLFTVGLAAASDAPASSSSTNQNACFGFFNNRSHQFAAGNRYADNVNPSQADGYMTDAACLAFPGNATSTSARATAVINSDGFTLTNTGNAFPAGIRVMAWILGGTTDSYLLTTVVTAGSGNETVTGLPWQPDGVVFLNDLGALNSYVTTNAGLDFGVGVSSSQQWACGSSALDNAGTLVAKRYFRGDECALAVQSQTAVNYRLQYVGPTATGFTVNKPSVPVGGMTLVAVGLKGVSLAAGRVTQSNAGGNIFSGLSFTPRALLAMSHYGTQNTAGSASDNYTFSVGLATSTSDRLTQMVQHVGGVFPPTGVVMSIRDDCLLHGAQGSATYTLDSLLDLSAVGSTTSYVMDDPAGAPYDFGYLVIGDGASTGRNRCYFIG